MIRKYKKALLILCITAICLVIPTAYVTFINRGFTEVCFISVGQGDSCLVKCSNGDNILIDGGDTGSGKYTLIPLFRKEFVLNLDAVFVSHMHTDHLKGICELIENGFPIEKLYVSERASEEENYKVLENLAVSHKIEILTVSDGEKLPFGDTVFTVIKSGTDEPHPENENDFSVVMRMDYGENSFLFTGDATHNLEKQLVSAPDIDTDFIKIGHHGSKTSTSSEFIEAVSPRLAVISVGEDNKYNHPSIKALSTLGSYNIPVMRTDTDGNISIRITKDNILDIQEGKEMKEKR